MRVAVAVAVGDAGAVLVGAIVDEVLVEQVVDAGVDHELGIDAVAAANVELGVGLVVAQRLRGGPDKSN